MNDLEQLVPEKWKLLYSILVFPLKNIIWLFEGELQLKAVKLLLLFFPFVFIFVAFIMTLLSLISLVFRSNRNLYAASLLINWWDGGKSILYYWAGIVKFIFLSIGALGIGLRIIIVGFVHTTKDILLLPLTMMKEGVKSYGRPGVPWPAVFVTIAWIIMESFMFSYILTPMVADIISGLTNTRPPEALLMIGVFLFLFMVVGGSFACMHGLVDAIAKKDHLGTIKMLIVEIFVMFLEVLFFYREFVDSLAPWLAQMTNESFQMGLGSILSIASIAWFGIRSTTWFFFAKYGTPTLLMLMSREGISSMAQEAKSSSISPLGWVVPLFNSVKDDISWFSDKGEEFLESFVLPAVQILAVISNVFMLFLTGKFLFILPVKNLAQLKDTKQMLEDIKKEANL